MSSLDDLIARSRKPGSFAARRQFTLSREKAIEKQREFALRNPSEYVLELVQAAVFAGATYIAVDARGSSVLVAWVGGKVLKTGELDGLMDYLFADRTDPRTRHLVQIAVAVNAILQRAPRTLRIESGEAGSSVRLDLDARGNGAIGTVDDPIAGTYVMADFGGSWFARFTRNTHTAEAQLIETRCLYTPVPILLNGRAPFGYRGSRTIQIFGARDQEHFDEEGRRGVFALHVDPSITGHRIVVGGVWICTLPLDSVASEPIVGVICDDRLRKTADHSDVVQDHRFVRMLHAVQPHATQLLVRALGSGYGPPRLPRIPDEPAPRDRPSTRSVTPEPLPEPVPLAHPRRPLDVERLRSLGAASDSAMPLFWCTPEVRLELQRHADPHRFPFPLFVLTPGQALTLEEHLKRDAPLHRISSRADVDFIRRVTERQAKVQAHLYRDGPSQVTLSLHRSGNPPAWGQGEPGIPFCAVHDDQTLAAGVLGANGVRLTSRVQELDPTPHNTVLPTLPDLSIRFDLEDPSQPLPDEVQCARVLEEAWALALPSDQPPHRPLVAALLGQMGVPQLLDAPQPPLALALPVGVDASVSKVPLAERADGGSLCLDDLLALAATDAVVPLAHLHELQALGPLEQRIGFGHLTHPELEGKPAWGVGWMGEQWVFLDTIEAWEQPMTQLLFVGSTFNPRLRDTTWHAAAHPYPELVHALRAGQPAQQVQAGWEALYEALVHLASRDLWSRTPHPLGLPMPRARGMGRLALLHLSQLLTRDDTALLPTDGGAGQSIHRLRSHPTTRLVARHGVRVSEPNTIALTADERRAIDPDHQIALRYDDPPDVWRSLARGPGPGWLIRQEVHEGGLSGWLGLRHPFDPTSGLLIRATGRLIAIPDLDEPIACHGLLWPEGGARAPTPEQVRRLQLAGLRLYHALAERLATEQDPARQTTAQTYAAGFAIRAWADGQPSQLSRLLARQVPIHHDDAPWGTLEQWLEAPADGRPALPEPLQSLRVAPPQPIEPPDHRPEDQEAWLHPLRPLFPETELSMALSIRPASPPITIQAATSSAFHVTLVLNLNHRLAVGATADERIRRALQLEMVRQITRWLTPLDPSTPAVSGAQQQLVSTWL